MNQERKYHECGRLWVEHRLETVGGRPVWLCPDSEGPVDSSREPEEAEAKQ